jgi:hypothetical protein
MELRNKLKFYILKFFLFFPCIVKHFYLFFRKNLNADPDSPKGMDLDPQHCFKYKGKPPEDERRDNIVLEHLHGLLAADEQQLKHAGLISKLAEAHQGITFFKSQ